MIPAVYVATAMVTGVAAIILIEAIRGHLDPDVLNLDRTNLWLIGWWLVMVVLFLLSLTGSGGPVFLTGVALAAIFGSILLTGIVPLVLHAIRPVQSASSLAISAALVLVGGFLMRYAIVMAPQLH
jgi:formate-dependent nitrite reductase membrane component NrfD